MRFHFVKEIFLLLLVLLIGVGLRSIYFPENLNFSSDQAAFATESYEIWQNKEIRLIGPSISFKTLGREVFQGSLTYYFQLLFLGPAAFEPVKASYLFMLFAMIMVVPLFYGTKKLLGTHAAFMLASTYSFVPLYIDYTRFLWNPNFQLSLLPILILLMGLYHESRRTVYLVSLFLWSGVLLLFHYQFVIIIIGLGVYYFFVKKVGFRNVLISSIGIILGFSPLILFELRNQFYNTQTMLLYLSNLHTMFGNGVSSSINAYYFLSIIIMASLLPLALVRKYLRSSHILLYVALLLLISLTTYIKEPEHAFGMAQDWNISYEKEVSEIISSEDLSNYNIVNLGYDTVAVVQKYLILVGGRAGLSEDYYTNDYLFVITKKIDYMNDPAYEINTFKPSKILKQWEINKTYSLILLQRAPQQ